MSEAAALLQSVASVLWVVVAGVVIWLVRPVLLTQMDRLTKMSVSPTGVTVEFAEAKIAEAQARAGTTPETSATGRASRRSVVNRLQRNADLLAKARILWVDDHPENNTPVVDLLRQYGAAVDTPRSNADAEALLRTSRYDVVLSDVARDHEPSVVPPGLALADHVRRTTGQKVVLFTARFDPAKIPGMTDAERLGVVVQAQESVFAITNRMDDALHLVLDLVERRLA